MEEVPRGKRGVGSSTVEAPVGEERKGILGEKETNGDTRGIGSVLGGTSGVDLKRWVRGTEAHMDGSEHIHSHVG